MEYLFVYIYKIQSKWNTILSTVHNYIAHVANLYYLFVYIHKIQSKWNTILSTVHNYITHVVNLY